MKRGSLLVFPFCRTTMVFVVLWFLLAWGVCRAHAAALAVPNGDMESPAAVGAWSTTKPASWSWSGTSIGLTETGGAIGSRQTLYGNQIAGTLTSAILPQPVPDSGLLLLRYWVKRENTGSFGVTARLYVGGSLATSRTDVISTNAWTQYTLIYAPVATDTGKTMQIEYAFANGSGAWQGYLDEVTLDDSGPTIGFAGTSALQQETSSVCRVCATLSRASTNIVQMNYFLKGGTATQGVNYTFTPGVLTFLPGVTSNSFFFTVIDNATYESRRTVVFALSNAVNSVLGSSTNYTVTIIDPEDRPSPYFFYVDSVNGSDLNTGTSSNLAWRSFTNVNAHTFVSGDCILLKAGSIWTQQLYPKGSGDINGFVTLDTYGSGNKPRINAGGMGGGAVYLLNQEYWSINNLEITNYGSINSAKKQGILIKNNCVGTLNSIYVRNCYIHDVNGVMDGYIDGKESGGIVFYVTCSNTNVPSKWNDIRIENNTIKNVMREGILLQSLWVNKPQDPNTYWSGLGNYYPSTRVIISSNVLQGIGGDGIIPWAVNGALVEYNTVADSNSNSVKQGHAAIWPYICENIVFQYNEVCRTRTVYDGMAFDFDNSNQNCIYQFNYSHDNEGGFLNMCCDGNGNGNIARYNISQNDGCAVGGRVFLIHGNGNHNYQIYNNTVYVKNGNPALFHQGATSSGSSICFYNNILVNEGSGTVSAPGGCVFDNNLFFGNGSIASDSHKILLSPNWVSTGSGGNGLASVDGYKVLYPSPAFGAGRVIANNGGADYWGNSVPALSKPSLGAYNGSALPVDANADGIADAWVSHYFAANPAAGTATNCYNGNRFNNLQNYIAGCDPTNATDAFQVMIAHSNGMPVVWFPTKVLTTDFYGTMFRHYALEQLSNVMSTNWSRVPGLEDLSATGYPVVFADSAATNSCFYRAKVWLK